MVACSNCGKANFVKVTNFKAGYFRCIRCGYEHMTSMHMYREEILEALPHSGFLIAVKNPSHKYPLRPGLNVLGVGAMADIVLDRITHNGKCYISRRHCMLSVSFDKRNGQLMYLLEDGATDLDSGERKFSLNHTFYRDKKLEPQDALYVGDNELVNLGGQDVYRLEHYIIPNGTLENYKISQRIEDGGTT